MEIWERLRQDRNPQWYAAYLRSPHWLSKRRQALAYYHFTCAECGLQDATGRELEVHHKYYGHLGREKMQHLTVLCVNCHCGKHLPQWKTEKDWRPLQSRRTIPRNKGMVGNKPAQSAESPQSRHSKDASYEQMNLFDETDSTSK